MSFHTLDSVTLVWEFVTGGHQSEATPVNVADPESGQFRCRTLMEFGHHVQQAARGQDAQQPNLNDAVSCWMQWLAKRFARAGCNSKRKSAVDAIGFVGNMALALARLRAHCLADD